MSVSRSALASSAARSACCRQRRPAELLADGARDRAHPLHALAHRAELGVVDHLVEPGDTRLQRLLAVLVEEKLGVGQPRTHDTLVALDHRARIVGPDVADDEKLVRQCAGRVEQRKVLLVRLHRQDQALRRHGEELRLELAQHHVRPLDQRGHLVEQCVVVDRLQASLGRPHAAAGARPRRGGAQSSRSTAPCSRSCCGVVIGVPQHELRSTLGLEAMAASCRGRPCSPSACTGTMSAPCSATRPVHRPHELHVGPAVGELVAHHLGDRQLRQRVVERALQTGRERRALGQRSQEHARTLPSASSYSRSGPSSVGPAIRQMSRPNLAQRLVQRRRRLCRPHRERPIPASPCADLLIARRPQCTALRCTAKRRGVA